MLDYSRNFRQNMWTQTELVGASKSPAEDPVMFKHIRLGSTNSLTRVDP